MKKINKKIAAICLSVCVAGTALLSAGCEQEDGAVSYLAIDVNPSLSLTLDRNDKVLSVFAENEDANVLLYEEELEGMELDDALDRIASLSVELGYFNENNRAVNVTVAGKANEGKLMRRVRAAFEANAGDIEVEVASEGTFSLERKYTAVKAEYSSSSAVKKMNLAKFRLVLDAQSIDPTLSLTVAAEMNERELISAIEAGAVTIEPYGTDLYRASIMAAERAYSDAKGQLLDAVWLVPYFNDAMGALFGQEGKYDVNYGLIYNLYTASFRSLAQAIDAIEYGKQIAALTPVSTDTVDRIAKALSMTEAEREAFLKAVSDEDGIVTIEAVEDWLNVYFKNLTKEEREAVAQAKDEIMQEMQAVAKEYDEEIAQEYKDAIAKFKSDVAEDVPESMKDKIDAYLSELKEIAERLQAATEEKDPLPAAYSALETLNLRAEEILATMREALTAEDLALVEDNVKALDGNLTYLEKELKETIERVEREIKQRLADLKEERRKDREAA